MLSDPQRMSHLVFGNGVGFITNLHVITTAGTKMNVYERVEDAIAINLKDMV